MVIPRSRSRSVLSRARSATRSFDLKVPLWCSRASTRVVLPWSTWAMMATLRRRELAGDIPPVYRPRHSAFLNRLLVQAHQRFGARFRGRYEIAPAVRGGQNCAGGIVAVVCRVVVRERQHRSQLLLRRARRPLQVLLGFCAAAAPHVKRRQRAVRKLVVRIAFD